MSKSVKMITGDRHQYTVNLDTMKSSTRSRASIANKIKAMAGGKRFAEMADGTSKISFMLADEKEGSMLLVSVEYRRASRRASRYSLRARTRRRFS